jgi:CubicO group peptidase (beta-lactamase class C family)
MPETYDIEIRRNLQFGVQDGEAVTQFNMRAAPPSTRFYYASVETHVLGLVLRSTVGRPVADYLQEKIWQPIGAEADATWLIDRAGQEATYCCLNAVLRDYARLGLLLAHDGHWPTDHSCSLDRGCHAGAPRSAAARYRRLRLSGLDIDGRAADVRAPRRPRPGDLRDSASRLVMVHTAVEDRPVIWTGFGRQMRFGEASCSSWAIDYPAQRVRRVCFSGLLQ